MMYTHSQVKGQTIAYISAEHTMDQDQAQWVVDGCSPEKQERARNLFEKWLKHCDTTAPQVHLYIIANPAEILSVPCWVDQGQHPVPQCVHLAVANEGL